MTCKDCYFSKRCGFVDDVEFTADARKCFKDKSLIADEFDFNGDSLFVVYYDNLRGEVVSDAKSVFFTKEEAEKALREKNK